MGAKTRHRPMNKTERDEGVDQASAAAGDAIAAGAGIDVIEEEDPRRASYWIDRLCRGLPACPQCTAG
jgi:hypothetical protein